jgi:hypothetical protein
MSTFAIDEARKLSRTGSIAIIAGTLLGATGSAFSADLPYGSPPYQPGYYRNSDYLGCYRCSCCGRRVAPAAELDVVEERPPIFVVERVAERHWVQRDYIERRYPYPWPRYPYPSRYRYSHYYPGPGADPYAYDPQRSGYAGGPYPPGPAGYDVEPRRSGYAGGPYPPGPAAYDVEPRRSSYAGGSYPLGPAAYDVEPRRSSYAGGPYPPSPVAYDVEPRPPYRYAASSRPNEYRPAYEYDYYRPSYEYGVSPRPPVTVPSGYYSSGYPE